MYTWVLEIVTDDQTDSLTNLIKCVVVYRSYSYTLSLWTSDFTCSCIYMYNVCTCTLSLLLIACTNFSEFSD